MDFNIIGNASGATITPAQLTDQLGVTATQLKLGPLQGNGGPTATHALLSGSVAIDKGHSSGEPPINAASLAWSIWPAL